MKILINEFLYAGLYKKVFLTMWITKKQDFRLIEQGQGQGDAKIFKYPVN